MNAPQSKQTLATVVNAQKNGRNNEPFIPVTQRVARRMSTLLRERLNLTSEQVEEMRRIAMEVNLEFDADLDNHFGNEARALLDAAKKTGAVPLDCPNGTPENRAAAAIRLLKFAKTNGKESEIPEMRESFEKAGLLRGSALELAKLL